MGNQPQYKFKYFKLYGHKMKIKFYMHTFCDKKELQDEKQNLSNIKLTRKTRSKYGFKEKKKQYKISFKGAFLHAFLKFIIVGIK
jgi:hypothetical protein